MRSPRPFGRTLVVLITGLMLTACSSAATPAQGSAAPSAPAPSTPASIVPEPSTSPTASMPEPTPEPTDSPAPTDTPAPTVEPTSAATQMAGCGSGRDGYVANRDQVPKTWTFGAATIEFTGAGIGMRDGSFDADDAIPAGLGLTSDELAVRVDPSTHILLRAKGARLTGLDVSVVPWSTVVFSGSGEMGSSAAKPVFLEWRLRSDGAISISAPDSSGDYMVAFHPLWQSSCLLGDGAAYSRIKVN